MDVVWLFLTMPRVCLQFVIVVVPNYTHLLFIICLPMLYCDSKHMEELNSITSKWGHFVHRETFSLRFASLHLVSAKTQISLAIQYV